MVSKKYTEESPWKYEQNDLVWHYTNGPALKNMVTNHELWASSTAFMNDSGERRLADDFLRTERKKKGNDFPAVLDSYLDEVGDWNGNRQFAGRSTSQDTRYLLSAARTGDSLTLWRGYAGTDEVTYAVGLDRRELLKILAPENCNPERLSRHNVIRDWFDVDYSRTRAKTAARAAVVEILKTFKAAEGASSEAEHHEATGEVFRIIDDLTEKLRNEIKHEGFVHEEEVRIIVKANAALTRYRPGRFGMVPYVALTGSGESTGRNNPVVFEAQKLPIREICISPGKYQNDAEHSLSLFLEACGYGQSFYTPWKDLVNGIKISRSKIPFR